MASEKPVNRPAALITGGTSGIGAAYAHRLAAAGYDLILTGRREKLLEKLCDELSQKHGILAGYVVAELADERQVKKIERLIKRIPRLRILVNNAGYGHPACFHEDDIAAQLDMLMVHNVAALRLTHAAVSGMIAQGRGAIINVSSVAAFMVSPRSMMYHATKVFLNSFSESLALELWDAGIRVQVLCPGFTRTDFHAKLGMGDEHPIFTRYRFMSAQKVVEISLKYLKANRVICIPGWRNKIWVFFARFIPRRLFYRALLRRARKEK